jgi:hypothetical protein
VIWILLAVLGVPIWLVVGALGATLWSRRRVRRSSGVFACKVRYTDVSKAPVRWPRTRSYARWVHDVLIVHGGLALVRSDPFAVSFLEGVPAPTPDAKLGDGGSVSIRLRLDDGSAVEVAAPVASLDLLVGPFAPAPAPHGAVP